MDDHDSIATAAATGPLDLNLVVFDITYLTQTVNLDMARKKPMEKGLVCYSVYAKTVEDAILRLRAQEPVRHPIIEISDVRLAPPMPGGQMRTLERLILPPEMRSIDLRLVRGH